MPCAQLNLSLQDCWSYLGHLFSTHFDADSAAPSLPTSDQWAFIASQLHFTKIVHDTSESDADNDEHNEEDDYFSLRLPKSQPLKTAGAVDAVILRFLCHRDVRAALSYAEHVEASSGRKMNLVLAESLLACLATTTSTKISLDETLNDKVLQALEKVSRLTFDTHGIIL